MSKIYNLKAIEGNDSELYRKKIFLKINNRMINTKFQKQKKLYGPKYSYVQHSINGLDIV